MVVKMLTHLHMMVYTWWCWHIYKGEGVEVELDQLGEEKRLFDVLRTMRWLLDWNYVLIYFSLDQSYWWVV
jgi:hypothetical protein